jgi:hypothetical protein
MPIIFENDFGDYASNLLLAYDPLRLWGFESMSIG